MVFLIQILFKYYEHLWICYILYYIDIQHKELNSIQPLFINSDTWLLFMARSKYYWTYILFLLCVILSRGSHLSQLCMTDTHFEICLNILTNSFHQVRL